MLTLRRCHLTGVILLANFHFQTSVTLVCPHQIVSSYTFLVLDSYYVYSVILPNFQDFQHFSILKHLDVNALPQPPFSFFPMQNRPAIFRHCSNIATSNGGTVNLIFMKKRD